MTPEEAKIKAEGIENSIKGLKESIAKAVTTDQLDELKKSIPTLEGLAKSEDIDKLKSSLEEQGLVLTAMKSKSLEGGLTIEKQIGDFLTENKDALSKLDKSGQVLEFTIKAPITTGSATNPNGIPELLGVQTAAPSNVAIRRSGAWERTTRINTNRSVYTYTETTPKDGNYDFVAEGTAKPELDFKIETRYAEPKKIAAWTKLTMESLQDIPSLQSIATNLLASKHDRFREKAILTADGTGESPEGAFTIARAFNAGAMANTVPNPNIMHVINAVVTDVYTTQNYEDETNYMPSLVMMNPIDFFTEFNAAVDGDGRQLYPTASLFSEVTIGGLRIVPEQDVPVGKIFVADMSKYNTTNYMSYKVSIGRINDDFIKNQLVILGESRFHAFVKNLDKLAFVYDDIATIRTAIATV